MFVLFQSFKIHSDGELIIIWLLIRPPSLTGNNEASPDMLSSSHIHSRLPITTKLLLHGSNLCQPDRPITLLWAINSLPDMTLTNPERLLLCVRVGVCETEQEVITTSTCSLISSCLFQWSRNLIVFRSDSEPSTPSWVPVIPLEHHCSAAFAEENNSRRCSLPFFFTISSNQPCCPLCPRMHTAWNSRVGSQSFVFSPSKEPQNLREQNQRRGCLCCHLLHFKITTHVAFERPSNVL